MIEITFLFFNFPHKQKTQPSKDGKFYFTKYSRSPWVLPLPKLLTLINWNFFYQQKQPKQCNGELSRTGAEVDHLRINEVVHDDG
jgi:hypothetical protein